MSDQDDDEDPIDLRPASSPVAPGPTPWEDPQALYHRPAPGYGAPPSPVPPSAAGAPPGASLRSVRISVAWLVAVGVLIALLFLIAAWS
jgi:hypothetical protein